ncbi:sulfite exporter TauE/SafE family protein [Pontibacter qinzhouensis]|uniref:Probable membrane transporter protein n=1 Tax=Pontibacter qinzhouensis TaxID=2603253 RepID=A0A5C8K9M9_9BACT|nr:sulfite exporter TauE/SafE family protein [Pontibacter qinzhouensis]TXK49224.1 sulfite exporter TauE/SafE family protein [Pontibacter qinzhouensis]
MTNKISLKHIGRLIIALKVGLVIFLALKVLVYSDTSYSITFDSTFLIFVAAGFLAQIVDGALGMAYGVSCSSLLLYFGVSPAVASASVHTAEVFTTGVSGLSHLFLKNVNTKLFLKIVIPGVIGAVIGAWLISDYFDGNMVKPYVSGYLLLIGMLLIVKSFRNIKPKEEVKRVSLLGLTGGFFDAVGGGGWGPIVTSNLILQGKTPNETIGTVNTAEFFVAFFSTGVFLFFVGIDSWQIVLGLITGGVVAAPIGAFMAKKIKPKTLMLMVGILIVAISSFTIYKSLM